MNAHRLVARLLEESTKRFVGIVVLRGECALIIKRDGPPEAGKWACPGGHVDPGESDLDAAYRELEEETGIEADSMHRLDSQDVDIGHLTFYWTRVPAGTRAVAADDAEKAKWVPVDDLPDLAWDNAEQIERAAERDQAD